MSGLGLLFQGADQPAFRDFEIDAVSRNGRYLAVGNRVLHRNSFFQLREFCAEGDSARAPILVVPPLSGHFPILLRDLVLGLLDEFRVAVLDWANVRHVPLTEGVFGFDDNIAAIASAIRLLGSDSSVIALCQGGVPALAAVADIASTTPQAAPAALVLLAAPIDPLANPKRIVRFIRAKSVHWYSIVPIATVSADHDGRGRWVYPAEAQLAALRLYLKRQSGDDSELSRKWSHDDGADPIRFPFQDLYTSVMDIDAKHFVENIAQVFLETTLPRRAMRFQGQVVDLGAIRHTALATIEGALDEVAAPGQTAAAHALCTRLPDRLRHSSVIPNCGHFSLFHGKAWRDVVLPVVASHCRNGLLARRRMSI